RILHSPVRPDDRLDDHHALHAGGLGDRRIDRRDVLEFGRLLDLTADAHGLCRGRGRRRRFRQSTDNTTDDASGHTTFNARTFEVGVHGLRLDFLRRLGRSRVRVHNFHRLHFRGLRRRWWRRWWRWRRGRSYERHHRGRRGQRFERHQRNDDKRRDHRRFNEDRRTHRVTLLIAKLDGGIDDVAEHAFITWHGYSTSLESPAQPRGAADYS